jgi:hypothetical protein
MNATQFIELLTMIEENGMSNVQVKLLVDHLNENTMAKMKIVKWYGDVNEEALNDEADKEYVKMMDDYEAKIEAEAEAEEEIFYDAEEN